MEVTKILASEYWPGFGEHRRDIEGLDLLDAIGSYGERYLHVAPLKRSDGGRSKSKRPKQRNDCTVRAFVHATGLDYDLVYDAFAAGGRKSARGFNLDKWLKANQGFHGWHFRKLSFPAVKGMRRVNPVTFALKHRTGRWILNCAGHVMAVVDGVVMDDGKPNGHACVYGAIEVFKDAPAAPPPKKKGAKRMPPKLPAVPDFPAMPPEEVKAIREALGMTQQQLADALELEGQWSRDTVGSWEKGTRPISGPARVALRLMLKHHKPKKAKAA